MVADHDVEALDMRDKVEKMWKSCGSKRERKGVASQTAPGFSLYGDNVG